VYYNAAGGQWFVRTQDLSYFSSPARFNVLIRP